MIRPTHDLVSRILRRATLAAILILATGPAASADRPLPANSIGYDVEVTAAPPPPGTFPTSSDVLPGSEPSPDLPPLAVRLGVSWPVVEPVAGEYRWESLDAAVEAAASAGREIVLNLYGGNTAHLASGAPPGPSDAAALDAWAAVLRAAASRYAGRVRLYQVGRFPDRDAAEGPAAAARGYAFVFKRSAVAIRSADPDAKIAFGTIGAGSADFAAALFAEETAPYADALAAAFDGTEKAREGLAAMSGLLLTHDPSAALWVTGVRLLLGPSGYGDLLRAYVAGLDREAALVTFDDPPDAQGRPFHLATMERARAMFTPAYSPLVESGRGVRALSAAGGDLPGARASRFFDPDAKTVLMAYDGGPSALKGQFGVFVLDSVDLAETVLHDLAAGESSPAVTVQKDPNSGLSRLALPLADYPIVLAYRRATTPEYAAEGEKVAVTGERVPTAEEIIARHQAAQAAQDALLRSVRADAEETWHFSVSTSGSLDITFKETFYLDPNVGAEWEQKELYVNGVLWKLKTIPELPFILPEKVVSLPLKISLTKDYVYTYEGRESVDGHGCYVVSFEPVDEERNLARGRVWIDTRTFMRVRLAQVQGNLPAPIISNDQRDTYAPVAGPDGYTYWVLSRIDAQLIYSAAGRNFIVNKEVRLSEFDINDPDFAARRRTAFESPHQILRDTDKGLRYLQRTDDGGREVKEGVSHLNVFVVGGVFYNKSLDYPLPLAGVNYFDSDFLGKGLQANLFFAGLLAFANLSDPSLFGTKMDASADLAGIAIALTNRVVREGTSTGNISEREGEEVAARTQSLTAGVGLPFGKFFKLKAEGRLGYTDFKSTDATGDARCTTFTIPRDTSVLTGALTAEFNRRAWAVSASHSWSERANHEPWGLAIDPNRTGVPCTSATLPPTPDFFEGASDFVQYGGALNKEFYLPHHQKIRFQVEGFGGRDLDRFSKYGFGFFDARLHGFSGSGIRFTNGGVGRAVYSFNLGNVIRFDATVGRAHVKDRQRGEDFRDYTGFGVGGQVVGPWGLIVRLDWGIAAASDVREFEGEQEVLLTVLKLFSQR